MSATVGMFQKFLVDNVCTLGNCRPLSSLRSQSFSVYIKTKTWVPTGLLGQRQMRRPQSPVPMIKGQIRKKEKRKLSKTKLERNVSYARKIVLGDKERVSKRELSHKHKCHLEVRSSENQLSWFWN